MKVAFIILFFGVGFCSAKIKPHRRRIKNQVKTSGENFLNHEYRAEILTIFYSYFGRNDDFIDSF